MTRALTVLAVLAMGIAGCSDTPAETGTAGTGATTTAATGSKGVRFAECMRANGVREFPDPDASGELTIDGVLNGSSLDPDTPAWTAAISACKDLQPAGFTGEKRGAGQQEAALEFAQCMRDNGIEDFPDPTEGGPLIDTTRIPSAAGRGALEIPGFTAAQETCSDLARDAMEGR